MNLPIKLFPSHSAIGLALVLSLPTLGFSAESFWQSGGGNNWQFTKNWKDGLAPGSTDIAIFNERSEVWAGPSNAQALTAGAIVARGARKGATIIQPFKGSASASTLTLHGVPQELGGFRSTLLISNQSNQPLVITNREESSSLSIELAASGVIDAQGPVTIGSALKGEHSLTKRGAGPLVLGDAHTASADAQERPGNTYSGGFILEEGEVSSYASSRYNKGVLMASPFGLGTLQLKGGTLKSTSTNPRTYQNSVEIDGTVKFGPGGPIRFSKRTGGTTTFKSDSTLVIDSASLTFEQPASGNFRVSKEGKGVLVIEGDMTVKEIFVNTGGLRVLGRLTCDRLVIGENGTLSGTGEINCADIVNPTAANDSEFIFKHHGNEIVTLVYRPDNYKGEAALIFLHGASRDGHGYRKSASLLAQKLGMLLVVPEFDRARFDSEAYQEGGVMKKGQLNAPEARTFSYIEPLLKALEAKEGKALPYYLVGHSGGAQFVDRMAAFTPTKAERIVAVNGGSLMFPTREQVYPYGFGGLSEEDSNDEAIKRYLAAPITFYQGTADILSDALPISEDAMKQGPTRIVRGRNCYAMGKELAESKGWPFGWVIVEAEGQGHGSLGMWKNANAESAILSKPTP